MRRQLLGLGLAILLIGALFLRVDLGELALVWRQASWGLLGLAIGVRLSGFALRAVRWGIVIEAATGQRRPEGLLAASMIGFAGNTVLPARLGEIARAVVLRRRSGTPLTLAFATGGLAQFVDLVLLLTLVLSLSLLGDQTRVLYPWIPPLLAGLCTMALLGILVLAWKHEEIASRLERAELRTADGVRRRLISVVGLVFSSLQILRRPAPMAKVLALSLLCWSMEVGVLWLALTAFGVQATFYMAALLMAVLNLAFAVPVTPGNVGTHQVLSVLILGLFAVAESDALAFSLGFQTAAIVTTVSVGALFAFREGIDMQEVRLLSRLQSEHAAEDPTPRASS